MVLLRGMLDSVERSLTDLEQRIPDMVQREYELPWACCGRCRDRSHWPRVPCWRKGKTTWTRTRRMDEIAYNSPSETASVVGIGLTTYKLNIRGRRQGKTSLLETRG